MKRLLAVAVVALAVGAQAQEIGTEIAPVTPDSSINHPQPAPTPAPAPYDNPYAPAPGPKPARAPAAAVAAGDQVSAAAGSFGLRAGFGTATVISAPGTGTSVSAPSVGVAIWVADSFALLADVGFGMAVSTTGTPVAFGLGVGGNLYFNKPSDALRPYVTFGVGFDVLATSGTTDFSLAFRAGGGAAYFLSKHFSLSGELAVVAPMAFPNGNFTMTLSTFTPGVGAAWYF